MSLQPMLNMLRLFSIAGEEVVLIALLLTFRIRTGVENVDVFGATIAAVAPAIAAVFESAKVGFW